MTKVPQVLGRRSWIIFRYIISGSDRVMCCAELYFQVTLQRVHICLDGRVPRPFSTGLYLSNLSLQTTDAGIYHSAAVIGNAGNVSMTADGNPTFASSGAFVYRKILLRGLGMYWNSRTASHDSYLRPSHRFFHLCVSYYRCVALVIVNFVIRWVESLARVIMFLMAQPRMANKINVAIVGARLSHLLEPTDFQCMLRHRKLSTVVTANMPKVFVAFRIVRQEIPYRSFCCLGEWNAASVACSS